MGCVKWSPWIPLALCPTSFSSAMPLRLGAARRAICTKCWKTWVVKLYLGTFPSFFPLSTDSSRVQNASRWRKLASILRSIPTATGRKTQCYVWHLKVTKNGRRKSLDVSRSKIINELIICKLRKAVNFLFYFFFDLKTKTPKHIEVKSKRSKFCTYQKCVS